MLSVSEAIFIGTVLEGVLYGAYVIIFWLFFRTDLKYGRVGNNIIFSPLSLLFALVTSGFIIDYAQEFFAVLRDGGNEATTWNMNIAASIISAFVDVLSQAILIYRCWVIWGNQLWIISLPALLSLASFAGSLAVAAELGIQAHTRDFSFSQHGGPL
ncbi:hypothetical protein BDQ17DRAFT_1437613 [Cyathus striatus]|nr:hypothetical protein BDQ17DRAFT_1437613 [Cyathus striatus]